MGRLRHINGHIYDSEFMQFEELKDVIIELSYSQGAYGRLLAQLEELDDEELDAVKNLWESKQFTDSLDFIMYLENGE